MGRGRTWGRYSYRTVVGPAKAGLFKEEAKESEENEEKRVGSWQWAKGKRVLSEDKIVGSQGKNLGTLFISYSCGSSKGWLVQRGGGRECWGDLGDVVFIVQL